MDGNGRMGRLWQTVILMLEDGFFEYLPIEALIRQDSTTYYKILAICDREGHCTQFVEYMLQLLITSIHHVMGELTRPTTTINRLQYFVEHYKDGSFTRKLYLDTFDHISPATASRDIRVGVETGLFAKSGEKRLKIYTIL